MPSVLAAGIVDHLYGVARLIPGLDRTELRPRHRRRLTGLRVWCRCGVGVGGQPAAAQRDVYKSDRQRRSLQLADAGDPVRHRDLPRDHDYVHQLLAGSARLSLEHRSVVVLRLHLGLSIEETASTLGIPVGTAKSRLHYATEALRRALEADAEPRSQEVSA